MARPGGEVLEGSLGIGDLECQRNHSLTVVALIVALIGAATVRERFFGSTKSLGQSISVLHDYGGGALLQSGGEKIMPIVVGAAERKVHVTGLLCPGIHTPTYDRQGRREFGGADGTRNFLKIQGHGSLGFVIPIPL
jgi:hypothetical protein